MRLSAWVERDRRFPNFSTASFTGENGAFRKRSELPRVRAREERMDARRQATHERAMLDQMTQGRMKPHRRYAEPLRQFDEQQGTEMQEALRKRSSKNYGGLPEF
jgi:hypothetical protein